MSTTTQPRIGGTASPSTDELVNAGCQIVEFYHICMSINRVTRLVIKFKKRAPHGDRGLFFAFLAAEIELTEQQKQRARRDPNLAKVIGYSDHTGENAAWNADHPYCRPRGY